MDGFKIVLVLLGVFVCSIPFSYGVSVSCMTVYEKGSAPAVFQSPECPDWVLSTRYLQNQTVNCQFSTTQGRRKYQEDRVSCNLDMQIPIFGKNGRKDVKVGLVAVFDGHIGQEASEMASKLLLDYFFLHTVFGTYRSVSSVKKEHDMNLREHIEDEEPQRHKSTLVSSGRVLPVISDESTYMQILKEALLKTIEDIDLTFTKEALRNNLPSGSTAVIALLVDGQILVANVGDSKALLCSEKVHSHQEAKGTLMAYLSAKELTRDHNANREEERARIEAAGGFIFEWDVPLVNGHFPMTRAIGDVPLKMYGIIPVPELTDWQPLTANDSYLVVASDGIFESLSPHNVCDLLSDAHLQGNRRLKHSSSCSSLSLSLSSLADCIVRTAFERGSTDNLSVVVVSMGIADFSQ